MKTILPVSRVYEILRTVDDPEIGINIVDLGFVYEVSSEEGRVEIRLSLTSSTCPMRDAIVQWIETALLGETSQAVLIDTESSPPWTPDRISRAALAEGE